MVTGLVFYTWICLTDLDRFRVIDGDEFIRNLWEVHLRVKAEGYTQVFKTPHRFNHLIDILFTIRNSSLYPWACSGQTTWSTKTPRPHPRPSRLSRLSSTPSPHPSAASQLTPQNYTSKFKAHLIFHHIDTAN